MINSAAMQPSRQGAGPSSEAVREYLTFRLGREEYGIDILRVQEIRSYDEPTRLANAPACVKGVINLRGTIVPIVDLRLKLGCAKAEYSVFTAVVVLNVHDRVMGAVVDSVSDVIALGQSAIKPAPQMNGVVDTQYITGLADVAERMLILVDIESLMSANEVSLGQEAAASSAASAPVSEHSRFELSCA